MVYSSVRSRRLPVGAVHTAGHHNGRETVHKHYRRDADALFAQMVEHYTDHRKEK